MKYRVLGIQFGQQPREVDCGRKRWSGLERSLCFTYRLKNTGKRNGKMRTPTPNSYIQNVGHG